MPDAADKWVLYNEIGGYVCSACGTPTESEPCAHHQPEAFAKMHAPAPRVPVSMFERVEGCFACENRAGLPIPVDEFPDETIGLCTRHWNWWVMHFAVADNGEPPCDARLIEYPGASS